MKKWFKKRKDKAEPPAAAGAAAAQQGAAAAAPGARRGAAVAAQSDSGSEYTDDGDEPVHDFELAQEDYLVSVALATSANEYQRNAGGGGGGFPLAMGAAGALELSKKYWATCRCGSGLLGLGNGCVRPSVRLGSGPAHTMQACMPAEAPHGGGSPGTR
jgi:hypothetical protein